jgi:hypothetical protein
VSLMPSFDFAKVGGKGGRAISLGGDIKLPLNITPLTCMSKGRLYMHQDDELGM